MCRRREDHDIGRRLHVGDAFTGLERKHRQVLQPSARYLVFHSLLERTLTHAHEADLVVRTKLLGDVDQEVDTACVSHRSREHEHDLVSGKAVRPAPRWTATGGRDGAEIQPVGDDPELPWWDATRAC